MRNKKINKIKVSIVLIIVLILLINFTGIGRYVYNNIKDSYLSSKSFYFTSDLLDTKDSDYVYNNWTGNDVYQLDIELYSFENELLRTEENLNYTISCSTTSSKVTCTVGSQAGTNTATGVIDRDTNKKVVSIFITPQEEINLGEQITISVVAYTTEPYSKTISADFIFDINAIGADYQIEDKVYQNYTLVKLKNTYTIDTMVSIKFDPTVVRLDMSDEIYVDEDIYISHTTQKIGSADYVNQISFLMTRESSKNIKFYKVDKSQDYTNHLEIFEITRVEN